MEGGRNGERPNPRSNQQIGEWDVFRALKMTTVLLDRLTYRCCIAKTVNDSYRFMSSSTRDVKKER
ncbi:ATP-binding protein [Herbaspirillum rubrisubalbicans]|uniref:ATP-binding protein n=1 Tax=Herbaspirillum rubrisubalbicans TaxID=80842 RepID=UPI0021008ECD|nr:ATP-binding protein [Herbaspirillum rubrisubalbicans]